MMEGGLWKTIQVMTRIMERNLLLRNHRPILSVSFITIVSRGSFCGDKYLRLFWGQTQMSKIKFDADQKLSFQECLKILECPLSSTLLLIGRNQSFKSGAAVGI